MFDRLISKFRRGSQSRAKPHDKDHVSFDDVLAWVVGEASDEQKHAIKADLERPDSRVRDYFAFLAGRPDDKELAIPAKLHHVDNTSRPASSIGTDEPLEPRRADASHGPERFIGPDDPSGRAQGR